MTEKPLHVELTNTIQEVDNLAQLHRESLAFAEARERLDFLHQQCLALIDAIQLLERWQALLQSLHMDVSSQPFGLPFRRMLHRELPEVPRTLGAAIVEGDMAYIRLIARISGALALTRERKLTLVGQVNQQLAKVLGTQGIKQMDSPLIEAFKTLTALTIAESPDIKALCQPILERFR